MKRRLKLLALAAATIALGLGLRLVPAGLPFWVVKYGGSLLWAVMVYLLLAALLPHWRPARVGLFAGGVAAVVELSRLYHLPELDAFRLTLAGKLLLGRVFSPWHIAIYWAAIALAALIDGRMRGTPKRGFFVAFGSSE